MIQLLANGVLLGISLSFMIGPLLFSIVEASLEGGFRAGMAIASGMWVSDILFVLTILFGIQHLASLSEFPHFHYWASLLGGCILLLFGLGSFFSKKNDHALQDSAAIGGALPQPSRFRGLFSFWLKGFLLNSINPGTLFFWIGIATAMVIPNHWDRTQIGVFFSAMLGTLVATDTLKAHAARRLKELLTPAHIRQVRKGIGLVLMGIGLFFLLSERF